MKKVTKAVIPAAGYGTRMLPLTKALPKEMVPIVDKPSIQYIAEEAVASGITDILIILSRGKDLIENLGAVVEGKADVLYLALRFKLKCGFISLAVLEFLEASCRLRVHKIKIEIVDTASIKLGLEKGTYLLL